MTEVTPADRLKAWRARHGLSQRSLAAQLPTSRRNIEDWESGVSRPPRYIWRALADLARETERGREP